MAAQERQKMSKDNLRSISFVLPNVLSVIAIIISVVSFGYTVLKDNWDSQERISITNSSFSYNDTLSYDMAGAFRGQGLLDGMNYTVILSNNSKQKVSLVSYDLFQRGNNSRFQYGNMVEAVRDQKGQEILFPLSIDSGDSIALTFEINTLIPSDVNMLLMQKYGVSGEIPSEDIRTYLGENGCDVFGNDVNYTVYGDGSYIIEIEAPSFPAYDLEIQTSKETLVRAILTQ